MQTLEHKQSLEERVSELEAQVAELRQKVALLSGEEPETVPVEPVEMLAAEEEPVVENEPVVDEISPEDIVAESVVADIAPAEPDQPHLTDMMKAILMAVGSLAVTVFGIWKMKSGNRYYTLFAALAGCGSAACYITALVSHFVLGVLPELGLMAYDRAAVGRIANRTVGVYRQRFGFVHGKRNPML